MTQQSHSKRVLKMQVCAKTRIPRIMAALFVTAPGRRQPKCPSMEGWLHKMWFSHKLEYYSAIKIHEAPTPATTWMNLESILPDPKGHEYCLLPFTRHSLNRQDGKNGGCRQMREGLMRTDGKRVRAFFLE